MKMSREQKYRLIEEAGEEELALLKQQVKQSPWRQKYHIQPSTGLLNDPNGFAYYQGEYHLFYQWFPLGTDHGMKYWYHLKSADLSDWQDCGIGIAPGDPQDSHGAYSGSGLEHEGQLYLMYTGNTRDNNWIRHPYQCMAVMNADGQITKWDQPVIREVPSGYTDHFRDPKVWRAGEQFYCVIGAQRENGTGSIVVYRSPDLAQWEWAGELSTSLTAFGYMWECPDYFEIDGQGVLLFCPQGLQPESDKYRNIYQSGYVIGDRMNMNTLELQHGEFHELDYGFDFYAPQTTEGADGQRIIIGWMGLPDIEYPTDQQGWAHCLTLPRELHLRNGKLLQKPVPALADRRGSKASFSGRFTGRQQVPDFAGEAYELICTYTAEDEQDHVPNEQSAVTAGQASVFGVELRTGENEKTVIGYDAQTQKLTLDRSAAGKPFAESYGTTRSCVLDQPLRQLHIFVDVSSVEIFVNEGEAVFTSRIFPSRGSQGIVFFAENGAVHLQAEKWDYL
ncbi:glycoside hydrolase family 32 protein [Paenibacillus bovis]|uniref:Sucrose-6-phosphate hydrolase n=1 Tax=Paenibacillus bovis TaxID=1616788 RepID=A0A172ZD36_9BACL|nr:sucrose-6-phosphate hydrolase [Paenibacillus bovis]ANF95566.1 sucrose-6-phosphate hydrolase [Paenibacillus bovis]